MARTLQEIRTEIIRKKTEYITLNSLGKNEDTTGLEALVAPDSPRSDTAIWVLWIYVVAFAIWIHEQLFEKHQQEVKALKDSAIAGTEAWYVEKIKEYQKGDALVFYPDLFAYTYPNGSTGERIVKRAAITSNSGISIIKVATEVDKLDDSGNPVIADGTQVRELKEISPEDLAGVKRYLHQIQFVGAQIDVVSLPADELKFEADIYYNPLLALDTIKADISSAINEYLADLTFDGEILVSRVMDAIQRVEGVNDILVKAVSAREGGSPGGFKEVIRNYRAFSGYIQIASDFPLLTTLSYVPY